MIKIITVFFLLFQNTNPPGTVKVRGGFYIDKNPISNLNWIEFLYAIEKVSPLEIQFYYPDTTIKYNQERYYGNKKYYHYPVVGITKEQAQKYCEWRSKVVNAQLSNSSASCDIKKWNKRHKKYNGRMVAYTLLDTEDFLKLPSTQKYVEYEISTQDLVRIRGVKKYGYSRENIVTFRCKAYLVDK